MPRFFHILRAQYIATIQNYSIFGGWITSVRFQIDVEESMRENSETWDKLLSTCLGPFDAQKSVSMAVFPFRLKIQNITVNIIKATISPRFSAKNIH